MRIALLLLCAAVSGSQPRDDAPPVILDSPGTSLRYIHPGRSVAGEALGLGGGSPSLMYRIRGDGTLEPVGTLDLSGLGGEIDVASFGDTDAIWFLAPQATAAVHWDSGTVTRIELGGPPEEAKCEGCIIELVGTRRIVPGPDGGAVVVRNFADRKRVHRHCEAIQLSPTAVRARDVFPGFCAPVRTLGAPGLMVSEQKRTFLRFLSERGWSSWELRGAGTYEGWVAADDALYRVEGTELVRLGIAASDAGPSVPFPGLRTQAVSPARGGGLWAVLKGTVEEDVTQKSSYVLARLESTGQTSTSPAIPAGFACIPGAPEEFADGRVAVPCLQWNGWVTSVNVLVNGQWQTLRSAAAETLRANVDQAVSSQRRARAIAPWLTNASPVSLVWFHFLLFLGLRLATKGALKGRPWPFPQRLLAVILCATAGLLFGSFEQLASGYWRNDSLFPSFSREEWGLAKITAAAVGAFLGARLSRPSARPHVWRFIAASAVLPAFLTLAVGMHWTYTEGSGSALAIGFVALAYGLLYSRWATEVAP